MFKFLQRLAAKLFLPLFCFLLVLDNIGLQAFLLMHNFFNHVQMVSLALSCVFFIKLPDLFQ